MLLQDALRLGLSPVEPDVVAVVGGGGKSSVVFRLAAECAGQNRRAIVTHTTRIAAFQLDWAPATVETNGSSLPIDELARVLDAHGWCLLTGPLVGDRRQGLEPALLEGLLARADALALSLISIEADGSKMRPIKAPAAHEPVVPSFTTVLTPVVGLDAVGAPIDAEHVHRPALVRQILGLAEGKPARLSPAQAAAVILDPAGGAKDKPAGARFAPILNKADTPTRRVLGRLVAQRLATQGTPTLLTAVGAAPDSPVVERWGSVGAVVLAAGASTRLGRPKQIEAIEGIPMVVRAVRTAVAAGADPVIVVTGAHRSLVEDALADDRGALPDRLKLSYNPHWASGQSTSVQAGLDVLGSATEAVLFLPVDQPFLPPELLKQLIQAWRQGADLAAPSVDGEVRGAPAVFDRRLFADLRAITGDRGGRTVLDRWATLVTHIPAPAIWLHDIDSKADLP